VAVLGKNTQMTFKVPSINRQTIKKIESEFNEILELLFHEHMQHTEIEGEPSPVIVRPNIVIVPE
jgi:hypothetical protein